MLPAKEEEEAPSTKPKDPEEEIRSMKDGFLDSEMMSLYVEKKASIEVTTENYKNVITGIGKAVMEKFGGPQQYLEATVGKNRQGFLEYLQATYIPRMDVHYVDGKLPMDTNTIVSCHVWDLGFSTGTSTKPPTYQQTANLLLDQILTNGFVSQHDPLLVWEGLPQGDLESQENGSFKAFWLSYVKGAARSTTVLFLCQLCRENNWNLEIIAPEIHQSLCCIYVRRQTMATDLGAIALENAKLSARGAIRRSHCAITWLGKLQMLRDRNLKPVEVLQAWNKMATKDSQVLGSKRMALLNLLELPRAVGSRLLEHISKLGPQTTFSDECWASKKLQPGTAPRHSNKQWNQRLTVTGDGVALMVDAICTQQEERLPVARRKLSKDELEEGVQHAQMVLWMEQAVTDMGIPSSRVTFRQDFINHDHHLVLEVATAVSEKSNRFDVAEMSCVQKLLKYSRPTEQMHTQPWAPRSTHTRFRQQIWKRRRWTS